MGLLDKIKGFFGVIPTLERELLNEAAMTQKEEEEILNVLRLRRDITAQKLFSDYFRTKKAFITEFIWLLQAVRHGASATVNRRMVSARTLLWGLGKKLERLAQQPGYFELRDLNSKLQPVRASFEAISRKSPGDVSEDELGREEAALVNFFATERRTFLSKVLAE